MTAELPPLIQGLLDPAAYPERPDSVELVQTHISYVLLAGRFVYKLKKPVNFGFLDYTTPALRRRACEDEVRLNRRLSPDVYLGVEPVVEESGGLRIGGGGMTRDWAVQMLRLPADRMLETLIADGAVPPDAGRRLGEIVGRFHLTAGRGDRITAVGGRAAVAANWRENFEQTRPFRGRTLAAEDDDRIRGYVNDFLEREDSLLVERDAGGFVRDLHGDLRSAQIWILEQPPPLPDDLSGAQVDLLREMGTVRILDCIEFNERLRFCDTVSDLAFLATDLTFRRRAGLARDLLGRYLEVTGDGSLPLLLGFYSCYRAYVRGKVDSLGLTEREIDARQRRRLAARAREFFRLAAAYASAPRPPRLVAMMGISGSGKSYLARLLALRLGAVLLTSDVTRKRLLGVAATETAGEAAYAETTTERTYTALLDQAEAELRRGHPVVLDATFLFERRRRPAAALAERLGLPFALIWCRAPTALIERRLREREDDPFRVSDADLGVARDQRERQQPPSELPPSAVITAETGGDIERLLRRIERRLA